MMNHLDIDDLGAATAHILPPEGPYEGPYKEWKKSKNPTPRELAAEAREAEAAKWEKTIPSLMVTKKLPQFPTALDYVIDNFEANQLAILSAPGGTGKGWLELQLGIAIASSAIRKKDGLWCPFNIWKKHIPHGEKVLFITVEDSPIVVQNRLIAIRKYFEEKGIKDEFEDAMIRFDILALGGGKIPLLAIREGNQQDLPSPGPLLKILRDSIKKNDYRFIILDPKAKLHSLDENSNQDMTELLALIEEHVLKGTKCGMLIAHHENRGGTNREMESDSAGGRGASAIVNSVRVAQTLQSMTVKEADKRGLLKAEQDDEEEIDHSERLQWLQYRKAGKVNNSARSGKDYLWLRRNLDGVLLPESPPKPKKKQAPKGARSTKPKQKSFGGGIDDVAAAF